MAMEKKVRLFFRVRYLRLAGDDSDAIFTALELLISDERPDVDRYFHTAIFPCFHGYSYRGRQRARGRKKRKIQF